MFSFGSVTPNFEIYWRKYYFPSNLSYLFKLNDAMSLYDPNINWKRGFDGLFRPGFNAMSVLYLISEIY